MSEEYNKLLVQIRKSYQEMSDPNHPINVAYRKQALEDARKSRGQCPCFKSCLHHKTDVSSDVDDITKINVGTIKTSRPSYSIEQMQIALLTITICIIFYGIIKIFGI